MLLQMLSPDRGSFTEKQKELGLMGKGQSIKTACGSGTDTTCAASCAVSARAGGVQGDMVEFGWWGGCMGQRA